ncbi:bifunctional metallophosphatase/5'-nucleotidase [Frankia sp. CNm7]|uniref:Bifunctional metallophosphatase/5'-nucleotidase n=1 Tax=Frankia nepalensis TaxID=1836974 RepID=A0A937UPP9_9ACTN|nr:bifunctional metallophosphatase/5'-nucleotidase [Frankia nepalensis]MBL7502321.1 bifunctional metallophosphatase/5'-nucleotidase [Frankia nepalensis]MBL7511364.1 bifunctional metallophosphatase/5'-nucleotidase [Frankia nepalensis]MBL7519204.1 bifunctional metallophosphatase/5'-nucleotidase [Frankia nepalensis]MBL7627465.1 bifunctional metallophosphatase/5'-nucleotidase [Frankia nepalensis]
MRLRPSRRARLGVVGIAATLVVGLAVTLPAAAAAKDSTIEVQILGFNDFHGNLRPPTGSGGRIGTVDAGGATYLARHLGDLRKGHRNTITVAAGDNIGASPLISALFHDEPTINVLSQMKVDLASVGNHEFDEGSAELLRLQNGGCHPVDGCQLGRYRGADFQYLAANVVDEDTNQPILPPYAIKEFQGVKVGFIGMTLEGTPGIVTADGVAGLKFLDEVATANATAQTLKSQGVQTIVVILHEGGSQASTGTYDGCTGLTGPIVDIVNGFDDEIDAVVSGHSHQPYNCVVDGRLVTQAASFGRIITEMNLTIDKGSGDVVKAVAANHIVTRDVKPEQKITRMIDEYGAASATLENQVIGSITADINRVAAPSGETPLGNLIASSQLAATSAPDKGGAVAAFMNPGGVRADLVFAPSGAEQPGQVTYGEAFTVQPFANLLTVQTMTGDAIKRVLEQQYALNRILQPAGITYTVSQSAPVGSKVSNIVIGGQPLNPTAAYQITINNFLAGGGDGFSVFTEGTGPVNQGVDLDAFAAYLTANAPVAPPATNRITVAA